MNGSRAVPAVCAVAAIGILLTACSGSSHSPAGGVTTTAASTVPAPHTATGCGHRISAGTATRTLTVDGRARTFIVHIPVRYSDTRPTPLVLNLHGSGSTATQQELLTGM